jgi:zinc protease
MQTPTTVIHSIAMKRFVLCSLGLLAGMVQPFGALNTLPEVIDIPYQRFVLPNGLTLIVHEDHKAPIVAVNVWYHVGSKNEHPGRTGFAHLFEHLMFQGSENFNDDYFQAMERIGATDLNGTTSEDRTDYFENVPRSALDVALWMESDRMGHFVGAISQGRLDEQRGVVQNEKRQGENQPYGRAEELIVKSTYPANHPYSWPVIGSMEDLNAATLADVKEWFKTYYGPANAVLVVAGDIDAQTAHEKVEKYFGDIPSGPPVSKYENWIAKRTGSQRQILEDRVPQARLYKVWNVPPYRDQQSDELDLVADLLTSGKTSRLYKRLVYQDQIASSVSAFNDSREIGGQFQIIVTARPGEDLAKIERVLDEELVRFLKEGPTGQELQRVKTQQLAGFIRGAERIGGFGGTSDILAMNEVFAGRPDFYKTKLKRVREATAVDVHGAANAWLSDGVYTLEVHPFGQFKTVKSDADRSKLPSAGTPPDATFPELQRASLDNGLKVILAERHSLPLVLCNLVVDAGYAADQFASPGTARLSLQMLDAGTKTRDALEISDELAMLGANLRTGSDLDTCNVFLSALKAKLDESLEIFADVILNPSFPESEFKRLQKLQLDAIQREKSQPSSMAIRVLPRFLYGAHHAYGTPMTGSGTTAAVSKLTPADVQKFYRTWFKANNATIVVVGDTTLNEIKPKLEKLFGTWQPGSVPQKNIGQVEQPSKPTLYLMDRPNSIQSIIFAGEVAPPKSDPDSIALETVTTILGGAFTSRINMNLREDKHWSYGAHSILSGARGQRPFITYAPVQTDKTKEAIAEMEKEFKGILDGKPITTTELDKVQKQQTLELAGEWETMRAVDSSIDQIVRFHLPDDYFQTYAPKVRALNLGTLSDAARRLVHPNSLTWVVVGDRSKIEASLRELDLGEVKLIDTDGNPIE